MASRDFAEPENSIGGIPAFVRMPPGFRQPLRHLED